MSDSADVEMTTLAGTFAGTPAGTPAGALAGKSVLVVEDNGLLCCVLEETLRDAGCTVVGPFSRLGDAMSAVPSAQIDIALLDINLRGEIVMPLANHLAARGVPYVVTSAYLAQDLPRELQAASQLRKPYTDDDVLERLALLVATKSRNNRAAHFLLQ